MCVCIYLSVSVFVILSVCLYMCVCIYASASIVCLGQPSCSTLFGFSLFLSFFLIIILCNSAISFVVPSHNRQSFCVCLGGYEDLGRVVRGSAR